MQQSASAEQEDKDEYKIEDDEKVDFYCGCAAGTFYPVSPDRVRKI